ncbi:ABC transporter ATP-binding protein [Cryomorphaceae bacterium 1068]|nr:ABC transporter ATP-binding protein [Cryomorphaceae bacterium 1068]
MIKIKDLVKIYRTDELETIALNKINLEVKEGEFISIMGPSGCGKSTLLNIIGLLDSFSEGEYLFDGKEMSKERDRAAIRKANIGFIFQNFNLIEELSVFENVELPLVYLKEGKTERKEKVENILEKIGIAHRGKHYPTQLSGGQQQRVAVARAMVTAPKVILADEPTGNLDSANGNDVMELLSLLHDQGSTIIMVTHSSHDASYSQRTVQLLDGSVVSESQGERISIL